MLKVTSEGIEQGEPWDLTEDDREFITRLVISASQPMNLRKTNGIWQQRPVIDSGRSLRGYNIFEAGENGTGELALE
jgi:hypothetical protein